MNTTHSKRVFKSKIDAWLLALLILSFLGGLIAVFLGSAEEVWIALPILLLTFSFTFWFFVTTRYIVSDELLEVRSGPVSWSIPISEITSVEATRNPLSSPALSLDRLEIRYCGKSILVSPLDKEGFRAVIGHPEA